MNKTELSVVARNDFFSICDAQAGETDICQTTDLAKRMISLGVVPADLPEQTQRKINRAIVAKFIEFNLEPLSFKSCSIGWYWTNPKPGLRRLFESDYCYTAELVEQKTRYVNNDDLNFSRPGITVNSGNTYDAWARHTIARYVAEGNGFPRKAVEVLEKLNAIRLPVGASVMIWTPDLLTRVNTGPAPDPLLVVEFGNGLCVPLCRWND